MRSRRLVAATAAGTVVGLVAAWLIAPGAGRVVASVGAVAGSVAGSGAGAVRSAGRGWSPVFATTFSNPQLPARCSVYDGPTAGISGSYFRPDEVQVSGGMLRLSIRRRDFAGRPFTAGGVGCYDLAQRYGRYEYRARIAPVAGVDSYLTLWPQEGSDLDATLVEVYADRNRPGSSPAAHVANGNGAGSTRRSLPALVDGFHEYVVEWAPSGLRVVIDGELAFADSRTSVKYRWFGFAVTTGDTESGLADQDGLPAEFLIDWIRVYAYDPDAPESPGDASLSPSGVGGTADDSAGGADDQTATSAGPGRGGGAAIGADGPPGGLSAFAGLVASLLVAMLAAAAGAAVFRRVGRRRSAHRA